MGFSKGSCVVCTPTVYLTDKLWQEAVPHICAGICEMKVVKDHPECLVCLTLDGFSSHLQLTREMYDIFKHYNIQLALLLLEDGDTSQINKAFDQRKAKEDNRQT